MQLRRIERRLALVVMFGLGAAGLTLGTPAQAQEPAAQTGSRMRILVPSLEHAKGVDDAFGKNVAEALRRQIDKLPTHVSVPKDELKESLRKFKIDEKDLDCIKSRQLAVQISVELVMCGSYEPATAGSFKVTSSFIGAKTGETFDVPAVTAAKPEDAASQIFGAFEKYVTQLRALAICQQYLGSQQWKSALDNCNAALAVNSQSATALYGRARALMEMDSLGAALDALRGVVKINPMHSEALRTAGVVAAKMDSSALSTEFFRQFLELNPGAANVRINLAADATKAGNPEGALKMVEEGFKADAANTDLLLFAGHWALAASQKLEAAAQKAGKDKPAKADSLALVALGYYAKLTTLKDTAADPVVVRNMILIMTAHKQAAQGVALGAKYTAIRHTDAGLWSAYADALEAEGQVPRALAALDSATAYDTKGDFSTYAKRGQWLAERGQLGAARASLQEAIKRGKITGEDAAGLLIGVGLRDHLSKDPAGALEYLAAGREFATSAETRAMAAYWTGYIVFQRGSAAASKAKTPEARAGAVGIFHEAQGYFDNADAYLASHGQARATVEKWTAYIKEYTKAVKAGGGTEKAASGEKPDATKSPAAAKKKKS